MFSLEHDIIQGPDQLTHDYVYVHNDNITN